MCKFNYVGSVFIFFLLKSFKLIFGYRTVIINNNFNLTIKEDNCGILNNSAFTQSFQCIFKCQKIKCKTLTFQNNNCSLFGGDYSLLGKS